MRRSDVVGAPIRGHVNGSAARVAALLRRGARLAALALAVPLAACATKRDLKDLRTEVVSLQARQDSLFQLLLEQNRAIQDSLRTGNELVLRIRGDLGHQLIQLEQQLVQIQELTGQSQRRLVDLRQQIETRTQQFDTGAVAGGDPAGGGDVEQLYELGRQKMQEGAAATARFSFQQIVSQNSTHERAPDAQLQIAETYVLEGSFDAAYREFDRVLELFPNSPRAPSALFRAGMVAKEQGNIVRARAYFNRVRSGYPRSDEARLAGDELQRLRRS